jgi:hypothetical protein
MPTIQKRYPANSITPHGAYYLLQGDTPTMKLRSWDDTEVFNLMGGENISDYYAAPENVYVKDMKGLIPPWKQLDQKGATQDGRTFITSLYDPCEVEMTLVVKGRSPRAIRRTANDLIAALDAIQTSELSWFTHDLGRWWAKVRWMDTYRDNEAGTRTKRQTVSLRLRAYDSFWRTYDVVDTFRIRHTDAPGDFSVDADALPTADWAVATYGGGGTGSGSLTVADGQVVPTVANGQSVVARRKGWSGSPPVIDITMGSLPTWYWDPSTAFDFWSLPTIDSIVGQNGYRLRLSTRTMTLSQFASGVETVLSVQPLARPPLSAEEWTYVGGPTFKLYRSGALVFSFRPTTLEVYTAAGFGAHADANIVAPSLRAISFGDDQPKTQTGYLNFVNWGDQPAPPRFTCAGPGTFSFGNGPSSPDMVDFGPLLPGQLMSVVTDGQKRGVVDLTTSAPATQDISSWQKAMNDLLSFFTTTGGINEHIAIAEDFFTETSIAILEASGLAGTPFLQAIKSQFGILPPQGNPYSLLHGMFSSAAYIPPKPAGKPPKLCQVPVKITNGTADSQIIGAITPLRRLPY